MDDKLQNLLSLQESFLDRPEKVLLFLIGLQCGEIAKIESTRNGGESLFADEFLAGKERYEDNLWRILYVKSLCRLMELKGLVYINSNLKSETFYYMTLYEYMISKMDNAEISEYLKAGVECSRQMSSFLI